MEVQRHTMRRLDYLRLASDHMLVRVPSLSGYLRAECSKVATKKDSAISIADKPVCRACGNTLIPGWSCRTRSLEEKRPSRSAKRERHVRLLQCNMCDSTLRVEQDRKAERKHFTVQTQDTGRPPAVRSDVMIEPKAAATASAEPRERMNTPEIRQDLKQPSALANSRRARNKKASLQAMLAKSKPSTPTSGGKGLGLDLGDFLKG
ncbi:hypothetical protein K431DRAFT_287012 [Polychaeton citri CBS 116435]|uniref:Rpr2-domain-containing protein n=1 Tax=Polychaeton citri CBS 116435 TaxID=1314669 RepID=A0A9P4Q213_9PEZI|nr:hypothetical protein K431DRAFT_287012 [Polychaeton citri CBS 116435]